MGGAHPAPRPTQQAPPHPISGSSGTTGGAGSHVDITPPSYKRARLAVEGRPDLTQPLRIDTRADVDVKKVGLSECL